MARCSALLRSSLRFSALAWPGRFVLLLRCQSCIPPNRATYRANCLICGLPSPTLIACRHHILHLRTVNPHVNSVFDGYASQAAGSRGWMARRQDAPMLNR